MGAHMAVKQLFTLRRFSYGASRLSRGASADENVGSELWPSHPHPAHVPSTSVPLIQQELHHGRARHDGATANKESGADGGERVVRKLVHLCQGHKQVVGFDSRDGAIFRVAAHGRANVVQDVSGADDLRDADLEGGGQLVRVEPAILHDVILVILLVHVLVAVLPLTVVATVGATRAARVTEACRLSQAVVQVVAANSNNKPGSCVHQSIRLAAGVA
mmetsp:Transcript_6625/g.24707  ORF Transcript_6625/g.24707 Transcript_6625/m.24707 type:complete len:218 (-) Transcript_6625:920-1573(-)